MHYQHLTEGNRTALYRMMQAGHTVADVARIIGCHRSTIYRERRRNGWPANFHAGRRASVILFSSAIVIGHARLERYYWRPASMPKVNRYFAITLRASST